jgi:hypothetical protein
VWLIDVLVHEPLKTRASAAAPLVFHPLSPVLVQFRGGPLSLAEFMSEALTNPQHGYYTQAGPSGCKDRAVVHLQCCVYRNVPPWLPCCCSTSWPTAQTALALQPAAQ